MENQETIQNFALCPNSDNQYNNLSFGGTLDISIREQSQGSTGISTMNNNEDTQGNIVFANQMVTEERLEMLNNSRIVMDINDDRNQSEGEQIRSGEMLINQQDPDAINSDNSTTTNIMESHENTQSLTTDIQQSMCVDGPYINMFDYCCRLLGKLNLIVKELEPVLANINGPCEDADCLLENLQIPLSQHSNMVFQKPLETFADILQLSSNILHGNGQINSSYHTGEESGGTAEQRISAPNEENNDQLNEQLQTPTESNLPTTFISNENCFATLSLSLSQLMSQARNIVQELELVELKIVEQPQEFWRKRSINCLRQKWCPAVQGRSGKQRHYINIVWSELVNCNSNDLFILVQLLSFDNEPHPSNILVPPGTTVQLRESFERKKKNDKRRPKLDDLVIKDTHGFDKTSKAILCPVAEKEYTECKKNLNVIMFRLYKTSEDIINSDDEETDENEDDISIEDKLLKLCKMRICLCRRTDRGELQYVSNLVDTDWIEESKGNQPLAVDSSKVTPRYLCNCGNEIITVPLNTDSEKNGFDVRLNNEPLEFHHIRGVKNKQISFNSTPNTVPGQDYLNVKVSKESISETIKQNHNPYNGLDEIDLLDINLPYVEHSENPHVHKDTRTEATIQSNEISETRSLIQ